MSAYVVVIFQYGVYAILMSIALIQLYAALWTTEEKIYLRNRVIRTWKLGKLKTSKLSDESEVTLWFRQAGFPWMTSIRWLILRLSLLLVGTVYLSITSTLTMVVLYVAIFQILTEPLFKYSGIRLLLKFRNQHIQQQKETELFTLFALIKTDLLSSNESHVNVYYMLKKTLPYFQHINGTIIRFLHKWRQSPELAAKVFEEDLGGETAEFMVDILSRLHNMDRESALDLLSEQSQVLTFKRTELSMRKAEVQRNLFYTFYLIATFIGIFWFMWFMFELSSNSLNF